MRFASERGQALLSYLLLQPNRVHTRMALAELLWPEQPEKRSRQSLRQVLTRMRSELGKVIRRRECLAHLPTPLSAITKRCT